MKQKNTTESTKPKKKSIGARNRRRGNDYERKIAKELRDLGFSGVVTSRSESKNMDNNKVDLIDTENKLPCYIQLKKTTSTPQYFSIQKETTVPKDKFVILWNKQKNINDRFMSEGEVFIVPKELFYELIKPYGRNKE